MTNENLRMQMLAGVITEGEYKAKIQENEEKTDLNESMIGGIVGIGAINQIPATPKTDYEMAFEHFLGERYESNTEGEDIKGIEDMFGGEMSPADRYIVFGDEEGADGMDDEVSMNEEEGGNKFETYLTDLFDSVDLGDEYEEGPQSFTFEKMEYADEDAMGGKDAEMFEPAHEYITSKGEVKVSSNQIPLIFTTEGEDIVVNFNTEDFPSLS